MAHLPRNLVVFGQLLHSVGLPVHIGRLLDVVQALQHLDVGSREDVRAACRALLVHRRDDFALFDSAFDAFWREELHSAAHPRASDGPRAVSPPDADEEAPDNPPNRGELRASTWTLDMPSDEGPAATRTWSDVETLASKDFALFTPQESAVARVALEQLHWHPGRRRTRRWARGRGPRIDLRAALRRSVRTGGDLMTLPTRRRRVRPRPLLLICDVSGSMERYSRMLLQFAHAVAQRHRVEAFVFSTHLTRITNELRASGIDEAAATISRAVPDWSGGTRMGDALAVLHKRWGRRALHGSGVVLLVSDGWDRGDPEELSQQVARLQRNCHRLIWLNPLLGTADYAPLTRGLRAALPFVDDFLPARNLTNLLDLAVHLNALGPRLRNHDR